MKIMQSNQVIRAQRLAIAGHYCQVAVDLNTPTGRQHADTLFSGGLPENRQLSMTIDEQGRITLFAEVPHFSGCGYSISANRINLTTGEAIALIRAAHH